MPVSKLLSTIYMAVMLTFIVGCSDATPPNNNFDDEYTTLPIDIEDTEGSTILTPNTLPYYVPNAGLKGSITSAGASTATNLVAHLSFEFRKLYPDVELQVTASSISTGITALRDGHADLVPMSRPLTLEEIRSFTQKHGYPPTELKVAADALAIYVRKNNPVSGLTLEQLDAIFSQTQRINANSIEMWGQLGLAGKWTDLPIILYGYGSDDGAHQIFRKQVLHDTPFRFSLYKESGGSSIVQCVAANSGAIGFASIFFTCKAVRAVPLARDDSRFYAPTVENIRNHNYPLGRFLYICINKHPQKPFADPAAEFLRYLLSREGQQVVADGGNIPLDAETAAECRRMMD